VTLNIFNWKKSIYFWTPDSFKPWVYTLALW